MGRRAVLFVRELSDGEAAHLLKLARRSRSPIVQHRAMLLFASFQGQSVSQIAELHRASATHVAELIHAFNAEGFAALDPRPGGGRPRRIDPDPRAEIAKVALARPADRGELFTWNRVLDLYANPPAGVRVLCLDEFGPLNIQPRLGHGWHRSKRPGRFRATYKRTAGVRHLLAAYDPATGRLCGHIRATKAWREVRELLRSLRARFAEHLVVVLDNFSPHHTQELRDWVACHDIELVYLPTYASWLNLIECKFQALRRFALNGTDYGSHTEQTGRSTPTCAGTTGMPGRPSPGASRPRSTIRSPTLRHEALGGAEVAQSAEDLGSDGPVVVRHAARRGMSRDRQRERRCFRDSNGITHGVLQDDRAEPRAQLADNVADMAGWVHAAGDDAQEFNPRVDLPSSTLDRDDHARHARHRERVGFNGDDDVVARDERCERQVPRHRGCVDEDKVPVVGQPAERTHDGEPGPVLALFARRYEAGAGGNEVHTGRRGCPDQFGDPDPA